MLQDRAERRGEACLHRVRGARRDEAELGEVATDALPVSDAAKVRERERVREICLMETVTC